MEISGKSPLEGLRQNNKESVMSRMKRLLGGAQAEVAPDAQAEIDKLDAKAREIQARLEGYREELGQGDLSEEKRTQLGALIEEDERFLAQTNNFIDGYEKGGRLNVDFEEEEREV